jgi:RNA polymerase sigma factor (sigma-70 family)
VDGDEEALDLVVRETRLRLLAAARRIGAPQDAEDAVQAAYLSLVRKRGEDLGAPVFPWLLTAVVRIAYRRKALLRREDALARRLARPREAAAPFALVAGGEAAERIHRAVERLPAAYRDPVVLHHLQGLSTAETAGLLDLPEATVRTRLRRARLLLRSRLPGGLLHGLLFVPWIVRDAFEAGGASLAAAVTGGLAMKTPAVLVVAVAAAALGAAAGALLRKPPEPVPAPAAVPAATADPEALRKSREDLDAARAALAETRERLAAAEARASRAEAAAAAPAVPAAPAAPAGPTIAAAPAADAAKAAPAAFSFGEYDAVLGEVDWKSVGTNTRAMAPLIESLWESSRTGKPLDLEGVGRIQEHNGALIRAATKIAGKIPGTGVNGAYTHPAFMSHSIAATLEAAGLPLTEAQAKGLASVGREFSEKEKARAAGYDDRALLLQKVLDEAELKDRFFEAAFALLTPEQAQTLTPPAVKGILGMDLFSSGLLLATVVAPVPAADRAAFVEGIVRTAGGRLGIVEEKRGDLRRVVGEWAATCPDAWIAEPTTLLLGTQPAWTVAHVEEVGRREVALLQRVLQEVASGEEQAAKVRRIGSVLLPLVRRPAADGDDEE